MKRKRMLVISLAVVAVINLTATTAHSKEIKSCPQFEKLMKEHKLPVKKFSYIMWRESRCIPRAIGWNYYKNTKKVRTFDSGLLQINSSWRTITLNTCGGTPASLVLLTPLCNIKVASVLYHYGGGISNWAMPQ